MPKLSILIGTRNRPEPLKRCLAGLANQTYRDAEIVVLDDGSDLPLDASVLAVYAGDIPVRCLHAESPMGIARGRNFLMMNARGEICCILDDDAFFEDKHALHRIVHTFDEHPDAGIVAFKIVDYRYGMIRLLTPHAKRHLRRHQGLTDEQHRASYFLGGGHALRKEVFNRCQGYGAHFFYGHEELDLSFKAIDAGYKIWYEPTIQAHHQPVPQKSKSNAREAELSRLYYHIRNRVFLAYQHLPYPYMVAHTTIWLMRYGFRALKRGALWTFVKGAGAGLLGLGRIHRQPVKGTTVAYLKQHFGRLWY